MHVSRAANARGPRDLEPLCCAQQYNEGVNDAAALGRRASVACRAPTRALTVGTNWFASAPSREQESRRGACCDKAVAKSFFSTFKTELAGARISPHTMDQTLPSRSTSTGSSLADGSRLTQVFVNLLVNAAESFSSRDPARNRAELIAATTESAVSVSIRDNGSGIAPDGLPRIFDPFFTTKPLGEGTGVGLSISQSIVAALGGELTCETRPGLGTTFTVRLPVARASEAQEDLLHTPRAARMARVAIVDDDDAILRSPGAPLAPSIMLSWRATRAGRLLAHRTATRSM